MRVAAVQFEPELGDKDRNVGRLLTLTEQAARQGCRLVVWPEMATTGYCWKGREEVAPVAEPVPGPTTAKVAELAGRHGLTVVVGMPEFVNPHLLYNSAVVVTPRGVAGVYRKVHPFAAEPKWAANGHELGVVKTETAVLGLPICMDLMFPETGVVLAALGAQLLCGPVNWFGEKTPSLYWRARCRETGLPGVFANRWGRERGTQFAGGSCVIEADGRVVAAAPPGEDGLAVADVEPRDAGAPTPVGDLLGNLLLDSYRWDPLVFQRLYNHRPLPDGGCGRLVVLPPGAERLDGYLRRLESLAEVDRSGAEGATVFVLPAVASGDDRTALDLVSRAAERFRAWFLGRLCPGPGFYACGPGNFRWVEREPSPPPAGEALGPARPVFCDLPLGRVAFLPARDLASPLARRIAALGGADLLCAPGTDRESLPALWHLRVGAAENNLFLAATGRVPESPRGPVAEPGDPSDPAPRPPAGPCAVAVGPDLHTFPDLVAWASGTERGESAAIDVDTRRDRQRGSTAWTVTQKPLLAMRQTCAYHTLAYRS